MLETPPLRKECAEFGSRWNFTDDASQQWDPWVVRALDQMCVAVVNVNRWWWQYNITSVVILQAVSNSAYPVACLCCLFWTCYAGMHPVAMFFCILNRVWIYYRIWSSFLLGKLNFCFVTSRPCCTLICQQRVSWRDSLLNWHCCKLLRINP